MVLYGLSPKGIDGSGFVDQVSRSLTEDVGIFIFDNAQSHLKKPHNCLNPDKMNVSDGGKLPFLRDTVWDGQVHKMTVEDGT